MRQIDDMIVDWANCGFSLLAADFHDQRGDALDMINRGRIIDAALEAMRRIGRKIITARAALDRLRPPECRFEINILRIERHGTGITAHDAGQRFDFTLIRNHADPVIDLNGIAIQ